jgi:hypothetical protein
MKVKTSMSAHRPILPAQAIALFQAKDLEPAEILLADFAAAGLIKTYALVREITPEGSESVVHRDSQIPTEEWKRIVESGTVQTALKGGTVRLEGSDLKGGQPSVQITGISFSRTSLAKVLSRYCAEESLCSSTVNSPSQAQGSAKKTTRSKTRALRPVPKILPEDLVASVAQVMVVTKLGRTKINELMKKGELERTKVGRRTLISVQSVEKLVGHKISDAYGD